MCNIVRAKNKLNSDVFYVLLLRKRLSEETVNVRVGIDGTVAGCGGKHLFYRILSRNPNDIFEIVRIAEIVRRFQDFCNYRHNVARDYFLYLLRNLLILKYIYIYISQFVNKSKIFSLSRNKNTLNYKRINYKL